VSKKELPAPKGHHKAVDPKGHHKVVGKQTTSVSKKVAPRPAPAPRQAAPAHVNARHAPAPHVNARPAPAPVAKRRGSSSSLMSGPVKGFTPYQPKRGEDYMNKDQLEHFRQLLLAWKRELMEEVDRTMLHMKDDAANFPDPNDRATQESEFGLELRTRDRERKLLKKIDSALGRIDDGSYGYCEETGDEIGLRRLEARPVATLCVEAQERRELAERQFRDREDQYR
jgi:DnaK suppressor protein